MSIAPGSNTLAGLSSLPVRRTFPTDARSGDCKTARTGGQKCPRSKAVRSLQKIATAAQGVFLDLRTPFGFTRLRCPSAGLARSSLASPACSGQLRWSASAHG